MTRGELETLYVRLEKPLFNVVYRWVWDAAAAQDVVQEAFVRAWKRRERIVPRSAEALLYRMALNLAANRRRSRKLWGWLTLDSAAGHPAPSPGPDEELARARREDALRRAVEALPEPLRRVLMLCEFSDMKQEEIGEVLGIPAGTVASRRNTAMKRLKESLPDV